MAHSARYPTRMFDSSSLDKVFDLAFSFVSVSIQAAVRGVQSLSFLMGVKPEVIIAGIAGLIPVILIAIPIVFADRRNRRPRHEVVMAWPSQGSSLKKVPEAPSHRTSRIFEASQHVEKEQVELTDQVREQRQEKLWEASSEPSCTDVPLHKHDNSSHHRRAVFSLAMKLAGNFLIRSTTQVTTLIDRTVAHVQTQLFSFSTARTTSRCSFECHLGRVRREGWTDYVLSCLGWYPWQCKHCLTRSYFRRRT
ncbi:MAG: hypothetical protein HP491_14040 [Nitrospira sp.]|nr:hypothetical protein [Nitrospira sp.]MBH0182642.1 hypothetical protein [Nitrospira sp.]MBH0184289.1 hypothetical protein [Nitrospira sp.]